MDNNEVVVTEEVAAVVENNTGIEIVRQYLRVRNFLDLHLMMEQRMRERFFQEYMLFMSQRNLLERHYWQS